MVRAFLSRRAGGCHTKGRAGVLLRETWVPAINAHIFLALSTGSLD